MDELPPVWVRRFVAGTLFGSGAMVGILFYDAFVVKPKYEKNRKANYCFTDMMVSSEKRVIYLAVLLANNEVALDAFDIYALTHPL